MCDSTKVRSANICALSASIALFVSSSISQPSVALFATEAATRPAAAHRLSEVSE